MRRLKSSNAETERVTRLVRHQNDLFPPDAPGAGVRRWLRDVGLDLVRDLFRLRFAFWRADPESAGRPDDLLDRWRAAPPVAPPAPRPRRSRTRHRRRRTSSRTRSSARPALSARSCASLLELVIDQPELNTQETFLERVRRELKDDLRRPLFRAVGPREHSWRRASSSSGRGERRRVEPVPAPPSAPASCSPSRSSTCCPAAMDAPRRRDRLLIGYLAVHLTQHVLTPHFHFGEETHMDAMVSPGVGFVGARRALPARLLRRRRDRRAVPRSPSSASLDLHRRAPAQDPDRRLAGQRHAREREHSPRRDDRRRPTSGMATVVGALRDARHRPPGRVWPRARGRRRRSTSPHRT